VYQICLHVILTFSTIETTVIEDGLDNGWLLVSHCECVVDVLRYQDIEGDSQPDHLHRWEGQLQTEAA